MFRFVVLWMFISSKGQCDPRKIQVKPKVIENNVERIYSCHFNISVECLWQQNGTSTSIRPYNYTKGNGKNTTDCSIKANINDIKKENLECIGHIIATTFLDGSSTLKPTSTTNDVTAPSTAATQDTNSNSPLTKEAFITVIFLSTTFNVAIVILIYFCRRAKRKRRKRNAQANATTEISVISQQNANYQRPSTPPHTYSNARPNIPDPSNMSADDDGYLVPLNVGKHKRPENKPEEYEMVKSHVYEKIN